MKNTIKIVALALVLVMMVATLASCSGIPNGKYVSEDGDTVLEVKGDEIIMSDSEGTMSLTYTYEIKDDKIALSIAGATVEQSFERDGKTIIIAGEKYTKK